MRKRNPRTTKAAIAKLEEILSMLEALTDREGPPDDYKAPFADRDRAMGYGYSKRAGRVICGIEKEQRERVRPYVSSWIQGPAEDLLAYLKGETGAI